MNDQSIEVVEFSKFYMENVPRLIAFLVCQGVSVIDAADCVQETLIDALPPVWATLDYPYAWCRRVAHRKAYDLAQRRREAPVADPELVGSPLVAAGLNVEYFESDHEFLRWLAQLNGGKQREILAWTYDGATPTEIAAELDMDPATVRSTLRNARATLRRLRTREVSKND
ncbi:MAG TPA: sigma-70 family RNA polymerase sigma factor [Pseudonocardiaceae bacterium]|nr:sigma-70 family RNA polymerase sigma factor [Pseudonocardiaceae bacterium]